MRKAYLSLVALLLGVVAAYAQPSSWSYVGDNAYGYSHVVYAGLVNSSGSALNSLDSGTWLGAFIGDECRGVAQVQRYPSQGDVEFMYFALRIYGEAADNGKAITFRLMTPGYNGGDGWEYILDTSSLTYSNEGTTGEPSNLFTMTFEQPLYFTFPENIEVKVNETVDLKSLITFTPTNASMPVSLGNWDFHNSSQFLSVTDDVLKGLKPVEIAWLGMPNDFMLLKSNNGNYSTNVKVIQPATGITITSEYQQSTVYVNDSDGLTRILESCYTVTPDDCNEEVTWSWTPEDGIEKTTDDNGGVTYNPKTAGDYKLEVKVGNYSATMALTVLNRVESITAVTNEIHLFVGDNLSELLPYTVTFTPSQYIDKTLDYSVTNSGNVEALAQVGENWYANAVGEAALQVSSLDILNSPAIITVIVHPNVTDVEVYKNTLTYEYDANGIDITNDVLNNFTFIPGKEYVAVSGELTSSNSNTCSISYDSSANNPWTITAAQIGTSTITVKHEAKHTTLVNNALSTATVTATGSFDVTVVQGLTGFDFDEVVMGNNETKTITLTPVPASANFDASLITVTIMNDEAPRDWTLAEAETSGASALSWLITPKAIGKGAIIVSYNGNDLTTKDITIGQGYTMKEGWSWVTPYGGPVSDIEKLFSSSLQEMRGQEGILYNDPVYGYFGGLYEMAQNCGYKVKVKEGKYINVVNEEINTQNDRTAMSVQAKWNWIGLPYQYDHAIADAMVVPDGTTSTYTSGDRIVSKDSGFAEFNGTAWVGSLTTLAAGEGYLFYNASSESKSIYHQSEVTLGQPTASSQMSVKAKTVKADVWQYNSSKFADNMTIVADLGIDYADSRYTVGAFIGNECRGEGTFADGKWFITVHGDAADQGKNVTFKVYDTMEGSTRVVEDLQPYTAMAGTFSKPLQMTVGVSTGVSEIAIDAEDLTDSEVYTLDGRLVVGEPMPGIYVVKQNGQARKVLVK